MSNLDFLFIKRIMYMTGCNYLIAKQILEDFKSYYKIDNKK